jgi:hypothetical protein
MEFVHPSQLTAEQRKANSAALQDRMGAVMARVAADSSQSKRVRAANARDARTAQEMARRMRAA